MAKEGLEPLIHTGHIGCKRVRWKPSGRNELVKIDSRRGTRIDRKGAVIGAKMERKLWRTMNSNVLNGRHIEKRNNRGNNKWQSFRNQQIDSIKSFHFNIHQHEMRLHLLGLKYNKKMVDRTYLVIKVFNQRDREKENDMLELSGIYWQSKTVRYSKTKSWMPDVNTKGGKDHFEERLALSQ